VALGFIAFMNAAFGLRFLPPLFFAFFFAIFSSPLIGFGTCSIPEVLPPVCSGDVKMPISEWRVNDFQRENAKRFLRSWYSATMNAPLLRQKRLLERCRAP
jgi:hypothetical protein